MDIKYSEPLSRAWLRMKILLFRPFDIGAWFVLGFTAFLAGLGDGGGGGGSNLYNRFNYDSDFDDFGGLAENFGGSFQDFFNTGLGVGLAMLLGLAVILLILLLLWLSSRGKFMFLDNLVHRRTEVTRPWNEFASLGNSLFLWQVGYAVVSLAALGLCVLLGIAIFAPLLAGDAGWMITAPLAILAGTIGFILFTAILYIEFFLTEFVVPIMHRHRIGTMAAWARFLAIFREHPGSFILCGLFYLLLNIIGLMALLFGGLLTCCVGLLLMAIPYVGSVITLPVSVTLRYYTLDFLGQFGDEFRLLNPVDDSPDGSLDNSVEFDHDRTMIGPEDLGQDGSTDEPGPQDGRD